MSVLPNPYGQQPHHGQPQPQYGQPQLQYGQQPQFAQGYGQPPYGTPPKKRNTAVIVAVVVAAVVVIAMVVGIVVRVTAGPETVPLGTPVATDDGMVFVVTDYQCGVEAKGLAGEPYVPTGQLCRLHVKATNTSTESKLLLSAATLLDDDGNRVDSEIELQISMDDAFAELTLPSAETVKGFAYFDVPAGFTPTMAQVGILFGDLAYVSLN